MSKNKHLLIFPPGERDLQISKGTLENPKEIDPYHDKVAFVDTSGKGQVEIDEDMAIMIAHHLPPRACIRRPDGGIFSVEVEAPESKKPKAPKKPKPAKPKKPVKPKKPTKPKKPGK